MVQPGANRQRAGVSAKRGRDIHLELHDGSGCNRGRNLDAVDMQAASNAIAVKVFNDLYP
jgi:hypothetical protein